MLSQLGGGWVSWYSGRPLPKVTQPLVLGCHRGIFWLPQPLICLSYLHVLAAVFQDPAEAPAARGELDRTSLGFLEEGFWWGMKEQFYGRGWRKGYC